MHRFDVQLSAFEYFFLDDDGYSKVNLEQFKTTGASYDEEADEWHVEYQVTYKDGKQIECAYYVNEASADFDLNNLRSHKLRLILC
jgi:hypothetical protein